MDKCYKCELPSDDLDWVDVFTTEDDGYQLLLCMNCLVDFVYKD